VDLGIIGHVAVVTGGGRGLGAAICGRLASEGAVVVVWDRDDSAPAARHRLESAGATARSVVADVTRPDLVSQEVTAIAAEWGRIDILVNCAGFSREAPLHEMSDDAWHDVLDVCLTAPFIMTRAVVPHMLARAYGRIVNIASRLRHGDRLTAAYCASKAGLVGLTNATAVEYGAAGITANAVSPGFCVTERSSGTRYADFRSRALERSLTPRLGTPDDVADAVAYLVAAGSGFVTGEVLEVAGGRWR